MDYSLILCTLISVKNPADLDRLVKAVTVSKPKTKAPSSKPVGMQLSYPVEVPQTNEFKEKYEKVSVDLYQKEDRIEELLSHIAETEALLDVMHELVTLGCKC